MTKFELKPWKKIIIHEFSVERFEDIAKNLVSTIPMGGRAEPFRWCRGYIVMINGFVPMPELIEREMRGEIHWRYAGLCPWPRFLNSIEIEGHITIPLLDVSHHQIYTEFIWWAEANFKEDIERIKKIVGVV